jgi:hypothetical protein
VRASTTKASNGEYLRLNAKKLIAIWLIGSLIFPLLLEAGCGPE